MKIIIILIASLLLISCSEYKDKVMVCKGTVEFWDGKNLNHFESSLVGLRIENDKITITGNGFHTINEIKVCKINSSNDAKRDKLYFNEGGCADDGELRKVKKRGTYNLITKVLVFKYRHSGDRWSEGTYICEDSK